MFNKGGKRNGRDGAKRKPSRKNRIRSLTRLLTKPVRALFWAGSLCHGFQEKGLVLINDVFLGPLQKISDEARKKWEAQIEKLKQEIKEAGYQQKEKKIKRRYKGVRFIGENLQDCLYLSSPPHLASQTD